MEWRLGPEFSPWADFPSWRGKAPRPNGEDGQGAPFTLGKYGQLGHKDTTSLDRPRRVEYFVDKQLQVRAVSCGPWNTYVYAVEKAES